MKKIVRNVIMAVAAILVITVGTSFFGYALKNHNILIVQFGEVVDVKTEPGIYFKLPVVQNTRDLFVGERLYDMSASEVITSDKKTMIADAYVTWRITDPKKYYQSLASEGVAQGRIDVAVYNAMKNVMSAMSQDQVISGKDGSLGATILDKVSMEQYGIDVTQVEVKVLDLPDANKDAVYSRMVSERNAIAAEYRANGERDARNIRSAADARVRTIISDAQVIAATTKAEGETEYFQILAEAYGASPERTDFYNFMIGLDAMKESLANGGTITIDKDSPLYDIIVNQRN